MKTRAALLIVVFGLLVFAVDAQDEPPKYRLRTPSVEEYFATLPDFEELGTRYSITDPLITVVDSEFWYRYGDASFETMAMAFNKLKPEAWCMSFNPTACYTAISYNYWVQQMLQAWLNENPTIDLDSLTQLHFADFKITIEQRDLNADGVHEWVLNVYKGGEDYSDYENYQVVERDNGRYRVILVPVSWDSGSCNDPDCYPEGATYETTFEDINGDGLPEWVFGSYQYVQNPWYFNVSEDTPILVWRNHKLEVLIDIDADVAIKNVDEDAAKELVQTDTVVDNWTCQKTTTTIYDWNGAEYIKREPHTEITTDCTARYAEEAMWADDFQTAANLYDEYLKTHLKDYESDVSCYMKTPFRDDCWDSYVTRIFEYFLARRVLAYALLGDEFRVQVSLDDLRQKQPFIGEFGQALINVNSTDAETLCQAAYEYYKEHMRPPDWEYFITYYNAVIPGRIIEDLYSGERHTYGTRIDPITAGCDITLFSDIPTPIPTSTPTPHPTIIPPPPISRTEEEEWLEYGLTSSAFDAGNYELVLRITEQHKDSSGEDDNMQMRYYRALALEALNRPEEALAEYVAIYEAAPESAWGRLAALHLERVEGEGE